MFRLISGIMTCLLVVSSGAYAQSSGPSKLYGKIEGGWSWATDADITDNVTTAFPAPGQPGFIIFGDVNGTVPGALEEIGSSYLVRGALGMRVWPNVRAELSLGYRGGFEVDDSDAFPSNYEGDIDVLAGMASLYYDISLSNTGIRPYIGGGIGIARIDADTLVNSSPAGAPPFSLTLPGGETTNFAWEVSAGAIIPINSQMSVDVGYRYFDAGDIEYDAGTGVLSVPSFAPLLGPVGGFEGELKTHEAYVGVVINLN